MLLSPFIRKVPATQGPARFTPVPVRPRVDGWTPERQRHFLRVLAETLSVTGAARAVGLSTMSAYRLRQRPDARGFAAAWDEAVTWRPQSQAQAQPLAHIKRVGK